MPSLLSSNYLARKPIEKAIERFAKRFRKEANILDIGCGDKPYQRYFKGIYTGVDHDKKSKADIVCDSTTIPLPDNSFDAIVTTQTLEHTADVPGTLREIQRLLKPGGLCFISAPMTVRVHGIPELQHGYGEWYVDYWRFTKYGLILLCKDFEIDSIKETSGYGATMTQLTNYFFASFGIPYIFAPIYLVNNLLGLCMDHGAKILSQLGIPIITRAYRLIYLGLPLNYCLIIKKR